MYKRSPVLPRVASILLAAAIFWPASGWTEPGDGFKAGDLRLHPRLELTGAYDSNVFHLSDEETGGDNIVSAPALFIAPGLTVDTVDPTGFDFEFNGDLVWEQYIGSERGLSAQSGLTGDAYIGGTINPAGDFSLKLENDFQHQSEQPYYQSPTEYNWFRNRAGGVIGIHPGDDILQVDLGYHWELYQYYFVSALDLDKNVHDVDLDLTWKFLPKTAYVLEGDFSVIRYDAQERGVQGAGLPNVNSTPFGLRTGLSGLITRRLRAKLLGGWKWGFYESGPTYSGPVGRAEIALQHGQIPLDNQLMAYYEHNYMDSTIGNFFNQHTVGAQFEQNFLQKRLGLTANAEYIARDYAELQAEEVQINNETYKRVRNFQNQDVFLPDDMHDQILTLRAGIHGDPAKWFRVGAQYQYLQNFTNDQVDVPRANYTSLRRFQQHLIKLNLMVHY